MRTLFVVGACLAVCGAAIPGRAPSNGPSFDVASVKANRSGDAGGRIGFDAGGRFHAANITLARLISDAYADAPASYPFSASLVRFRIVGGPGWIDTDRFDVEGRPGGSPDYVRSHAMLRALLAERFQLAVHTETREVAGYNLVRARADGRLGPRLRVSSVDCAALRAAGTLPSSPAPGPERPCVMRFGRSQSMAIGLTMAELAGSVLTRYAGRTVVNRTGLDGPFEWTLEWTPDQLLPTVGGETPIDPNGPSLFAALQEQLGLKLEATRAPVSVVVIDRAERPTEN